VRKIGEKTSLKPETAEVILALHFTGIRAHLQGFKKLIFHDIKEDSHHCIN